MSYLFGPVSGDVLLLEPVLTAVFVVFIAATIIGLGLWLGSGHYKKSNPLAHTQLSRLGQWLFWVGISALIVSGCFYEGALFNRRFWLYLLLAFVYAVVAYATYFYFRRYPALERHQENERQRNKKYVPAPHTLGKWGTQQRTSRKRR